MDKDEKYIGYLRYTGKSVEDGLLDVRKSAEALTGYDEILRYFLIKEDPRLLGYEFEIPVRIKQGSWDVVIPELAKIILSPKGIAYTYLTVTATKAAQDGLFSTGAAKDIKGTFRAAIKSAQWMIRIGSRIGMLKKKLGEVKVSSPDGDVLVPDQKDGLLKVPQKYFDLFIECPNRLFSKNAKLVDEDRVLEIGVFDAGKEERVSIKEEDKRYYYAESEDEDILFPELVDGQHVELEGIITRGNEKSNTVGFEYNEHILTCVPKDGNIAAYKNKIISHQKDHFFPKVKMIGVVDRVSVKEEFKENRPRIIFSDIILLEKEDSNLKLF